MCGRLAYIPRAFAIEAVVIALTSIIGRARSAVGAAAVHVRLHVHAVVLTVVASKRHASILVAELARLAIVCAEHLRTLLTLAENADPDVCARARGAVGERQVNRLRAVADIERADVPIVWLIVRVLELLDLAVEVAHVDLAVPWVLVRDFLPRSDLIAALAFLADSSAAPPVDRAPALVVRRACASRLDLTENTSRRAGRC